VGGKWIEARVMGVFEIRGGKIKAWRDYFDLAEFQSQMSGG
jgi:limonene-1,2-epoxide hydrolase